MRNLSDYLVEVGAVAGGGVALFGTVAVIAAAVARELGYRQVSFGEWAAYGGGLGGLFGLLLKQEVAGSSPAPPIRLLQGICGSAA